MQLVGGRLVLLLLAHAPTCCRALTVFTPGAFVIKRQVGQLGFKTETEWAYRDRDTGIPAAPNPLDPLQPKRTVESSGVSIRLFDATIYSDDTRVLLKEFIGDESKAIGETEREIHKLLYDRAFEAGQPIPSKVGRLLGTMRADSTFGSPAFQAEWERALPDIPPPSPNGLWLVFVWEGLRPVASFPSFPQEGNWFDLNGRVAKKERGDFVRTTTRRCLETVGWLHSNGVVHRSLGGSSLILNTYDQSVKEGRVAVKAIDLGFAAAAGTLQPEEVARAMQRGARSPVDVLPFLSRADDLHALAYVLLELILASATPAPAPPNGGGGGSLFASGGIGGGGSGSGNAAVPRPTDLQSLKRLVEDVFQGDVCNEFRDYCAEEPSWAPMVELLDESDRAGWKLLQSLVACREPASEEAEGVSCAKLLESEWFS